MPPVKEAALSLDLPVYQPIILRDDAVQKELIDLAPDVIVVIAYGKIFCHHGLFVCLNMDVLISMHLYCQNMGGSTYPLCYFKW